MTIAPGQALLLPEQLHGLTVLVRVSSNKTPDLTAGIAAIRERGGRPGVLLDGAPRDGQQGIYELKLQLSDLRGRLAPDVPLALAPPSSATDAEIAAVAPYADVIVTSGTISPPGHRTWRRLGAVGLHPALAETAQGGFEMWVLDVPVDVTDAAALIDALARAAAPPPDALIESVEVRAGAPLSAEEIVARHQAVAQRQASRVRTVISTGTLTITFEAPGFPAPVSISSRTVIYQGAGRTELEQREIRVNGLAFEGRGIPRLPILEPERVSALPLAITLEPSYRYARGADEIVNGIPCHVVAFEPTREGPAFRGRAWIAVGAYYLVRVAAVQTALRGPIVSSEQVDDYREVAADVWLPARSEIRQLFEGAAHRTPIQRVLVIEDAEINPADFEARLQAAYRSDAVMLRDTASGYRYLQRDPEGRQGAGTETPRIAEARASRVRTLAAGVIIDPNISIPLPFAGLNYADFDLFGKGIQFNGFFGGSYGQAALAIPSLAGTRWQLGARAFAIASSYNDRAFRSGREVYEENVRQRPAHASVWLLRPLGPRLALRAGYELDYTALNRAPETGEAFVVPEDQMVHGARAALEGQWSGWAASVWWNGARRSGWRHWGMGSDDYAESHRDFQRFGASLSRSTALVPAFVTRFEGAVMAGRDLDRFSRYTFGTFDNRLRGYPAALVRYDRGAVLRAAFAWSASRFARVDGFFDTAVVRDRGYGVSYRNYTGTGAAIEAPLPFGILGSVEWGYGFRGVDANGSPGTHVIRVSAMKVF